MAIEQAPIRIDAAASPAPGRLAPLVQVLCGLAIAVSLLGISLVPALLPSTTTWLADRHARVAESGISAELMRSVVSDLHSFSVLGTLDDLPETVEGRPAFDADMVDHLVDVRIVIRGAMFATAASTVTAFILAVYLRRRPRLLGLSLIVGGTIPLVMVATLGLWAAVDFGSFFSWFHTLFFAGGTWTFPSSSLLIQAVPEPFWSAMGAVWLGTLAVLSVTTVIVGALIARTARRSRLTATD